MIDLSLRLIFDRYYDSANQLLNIIDTTTLYVKDSGRWAKNQNNYALLNYFQGNYSASLAGYTNMLQWARQNHDSAAIAMTSKNLGITYKMQGKYELAMDFYLVALRHAESVFDSSEIGTLQNSLGNLHMAIEEYPEALDAFEQATMIWQALTDEYLYSMGLNNKAEAFRSMALYDSAKAYFKKSLLLRQQLDDAESLGFTLKGLGRTYLDAEQFDSGFVCLHEGRQLFVSVGNKHELAHTGLYLAEAHLAQKRADSARFYLQYARPLIASTGARDLRATWLGLSKAYQRYQGQYARALQTDAVLDALRDSLFQEERLNVVELRSAYRLEQEAQRTTQAESRRALAEVQSERRRQLNWAIGIVAFVLLTGLVVLYQNRQLILQQRQQISVLNDDLQQLNRDIRHRKQNDYMRILAYFSATRRHMPELGEVLQPLEHMLMASAQVDELLYREEGAREIDLKPYLTGLLEELRHALALNQPRTVKVQAAVTSVKVPLDKAAKLAFIVSEWVTNAFKYAYGQLPPHVQPELRLQVVRQAGQIEVQLHDNGPGLGQADLGNGSGLGFKLVQGFVANLNGVLQVQARAGTHYVLTFPDYGNE